MLKSLLTRQNISIVVVIGGAGWFLQRISELLVKHTDGWAYFATPPGVGDVLAIVGAGLLTLAGALGVTFKKPE